MVQFYGGTWRQAAIEKPPKIRPMHALSRQQLILLVLLTLVWGLNWPIMKIGVTGFPPLTFRTICMWLGLPVLGLFLLWRKVPFRIDRVHWRELAVLTVTNMFFWHTLAILAIQSLSSGRAAILGYTMPVWAVVFGLLAIGPWVRMLRGRTGFDSKADPGDPLISIDSLDGLIGLVQSAALEIHPWGSSLEDWERPDMITIDLTDLPDAGLGSRVELWGGNIPVNFHIGGSETAIDWMGQQGWPSLTRDLRSGISGAMIFFNNGKVVSNLIYSGILDRFKGLKFVSVESGIGWVPFLMQALDYQLKEIAETKRKTMVRLSRTG